MSDYSNPIWDYYNRSSKIEIQFDDGSKEVFNLDDSKKVEELKFKKTHRADSFKVKIKGVHSGSAYAERVQHRQNQNEHLLFSL